MATDYNRQSVAEVLALQPRVTVFVPTYNEQEAITACLQRIVAQDYPAHLLEILVVDGRSEDGTVMSVLRFAEQLRAEAKGLEVPEIRVIDNPERNQAAAWDPAMQEATGEIVAYVVAHSFIAPDFISKSVQRLREGNADAVGGPYRMVGLGYVGGAVAVAMSSRFGVGQSRYRWGDDVEDIDSLANAVYPLVLLKSFLPFDSAVGRGVGEDWDMHYRMRQAGVKLNQYGDIKHEFHARSSLRKLCVQQARYAAAKVRILQKHGLDALRLTHFIPLVFLLWIIVGGAAAAVSAKFLPVWLGVLALYVVLNLAASVRSSLRQGLSFLPVLPIVFLCMHLSYGAGMLWAFLQGPWRPQSIDTRQGPHPSTGSAASRQ